MNIFKEFYFGTHSHLPKPFLIYTNANIHTEIHMKQRQAASVNWRTDWVSLSPSRIVSLTLSLFRICTATFAYLCEYYSVCLSAHRQSSILHTTYVLLVRASCQGYRIKAHSFVYVRFVNLNKSFKENHMWNHSQIKCLNEQI